MSARTDTRKHWPGVEEFLQHSFLKPRDPGWVSEFFERQAQEAESSPPP
jgi:hypothetical protein